MVTSCPWYQSHLLLIVAAICLRALVFTAYIDHDQRYQQPDSTDYHNAALCIRYGFGMHRPDTGEPIFWRTPGYPTYLALFYKLFGVHSGNFKNQERAHRAALWGQIVINSFIPSILVLLALTLTQNIGLAWLVGWLGVVHVGLIAASSFLLTEGLALIFFYLFLLFFYRSFTAWGEQKYNRSWIKNTIAAALFLGLASWIRPMGEFVSLVCVFIIFIAAQTPWRKKCTQALLFVSVFLLSLSPWYIRNYKLTEHVFFCPMSGPILSSFIAPRILRDTHGVPLEQSLHALTRAAFIRAHEKKALTGKKVPVELCCKDIALPIIMRYPWHAIYTWLGESVKATFDLYSYQFAAIAANNFRYDPIEEFLQQKVTACLYKQPMPLLLRIICWLEFLFSVFLWIGMFAGLWSFIIVPVHQHLHVSADRYHLFGLWLKVVPMIGGVLLMTGGFGYARLRLPVEPLIIILALSWLYWQRR